MSGDVPDPVGLADHALRIDHVRPPLRELGRRFLWESLRLVDLTRLPVDVGQEREREALLLGKGQVVLRGVERGADQGDACFLELGGSITEPLAFLRSPGREGLGEPPQDQPSPAVVTEGDRVPVLVGEGERRGLHPFLEHGIRV